MEKSKKIPKDISIEKIERILGLVQASILESKDGIPMINGKFAAKFYTEHGIPPEILEDWVNSYISTGVAKFNM